MRSTTLLRARILAAIVATTFAVLGASACGGDDTVSDTVVGAQIGEARWPDSERRVVWRIRTNLSTYGNLYRKFGVTFEPRDKSRPEKHKSRPGEHLELEQRSQPLDAAIPIARPCLRIDRCT
jgi:hypothetical protein